MLVILASLTKALCTFWAEVPSSRKTSVLCLLILDSVGSLTSEPLSAPPEVDESCCRGSMLRVKGPVVELVVGYETF